MAFLPVPLDALITRDSFDKTKGYRQLLWQKGKAVLDAELNEQQQIYLDFMKTMLETYGDFFRTSSAFKVIESAANNSNNFEIESGETFIKGVNGFLPADLEYEDQIGDEDFIRKFYWDADVTVPALTTPSGSDRNDLVVLTIVIREVDSTQDPNLKDPNLNKETAIRFQAVTGITVKEGFGTFPDTTGFEASFAFENGNFVFRAPIAWLRRLDGNATITSAMVVDARKLVFTGDTILDKATKLFDFQESVKDKDLNTPPGSPTTGDRYIVAAGGTGLWSGKDKEIAEWNGTAWDFFQPSEGTIVFVEDENIMYVFDGIFPSGNWVKFASLVNHANLNNVLQVNPDSLDTVRDKHVANLDIKKDNFTAIVPPTANNDNTQNYQPGSLWYDTVGGELFQNVANPTGAAVWTSMTGGGLGFADAATVKVDGTIGVDTEFTDMTSAIAAGEKLIVVKIPEVISISNIPTAAGGAQVTITTSSPHGLIAADRIMIFQSDSIDNIDGIWDVDDAPTTTTFRITLPGGGGIGTGGSAGILVQVLKDTIAFTPANSGLIIVGEDRKLCGWAPTGAAGHTISGASATNPVRDINFRNMNLGVKTAAQWWNLTSHAERWNMEGCLLGVFPTTPNQALPVQFLRCTQEGNLLNFKIRDNTFGDVSSFCIVKTATGSSDVDFWEIYGNSFLDQTLAAGATEAIISAAGADGWIVRNNTGAGIRKRFINLPSLDNTDWIIKGNNVTGQSDSAVNAMHWVSGSRFVGAVVQGNSFTKFNFSLHSEHSASDLEMVITGNDFSDNLSGGLTGTFQGAKAHHNLGVLDTEAAVVRADGVDGAFSTILGALASVQSTGNKRILIARPKVTAITSIPTATSGNPVTITAAGHGLVNTDYVQIRDTNSTPIIDGIYQVSSVAADTFQITAPVTITVAGTAGKVGKVITEQITLVSEDEGLVIEGEDKVWSSWLNIDSVTSNGSIINIADNTTIKNITLRNMHLLGIGWGNSRDLLNLSGTGVDPREWIFEDLFFNEGLSSVSPGLAFKLFAGALADSKLIRCKFGRSVQHHISVIGTFINNKIISCRFTNGAGLLSLFGLQTDVLYTGCEFDVTIFPDISGLKFTGCIFLGNLSLTQATLSGVVVVGCSMATLIIGDGLTDSVIEGNIVTSFTATSATPFLNGVIVKNNVGIANHFRTALTTTFSTTSTTQTPVTGLQITPAAGKYEITVSGSGNVTDNGALATYGISIGGASIENTTARSFGASGSGLNMALSSELVVDLNGSQTVDVGVLVDVGTFNIDRMSLILQRIS